MKIIKSILAIVAGIIGGSFINAGIIILCKTIFDFPEDMILWDEESVKAHADKLTTANILCMLMAHQLGTLAGAYATAKIAPYRKMIFSLAIGVWFLGCGIYAVSLIPAPVWFVTADLLLYIPFAIMGGRFGGALKRKLN